MVVQCSYGSLGTIGKAAIQAIEGHHWVELTEAYNVPCAGRAGSAGAHTCPLVVIDKHLGTQGGGLPTKPGGGSPYSFAG